jgi:hypothetical protein
MSQQAWCSSCLCALGYCHAEAGVATTWQEALHQLL